MIGMAACLTPITIVKPGLDLTPHSCPSYFWRDTIRPYTKDTLVVPCGKCINCLKNKQNSMVVRIKREAEKRGSLCFVTLTYDEEHLPLAQSLWSVSRSTGELTLECPAEIISSARFPDPVRLGQIRAIRPSETPRYLEIPIPAFSSCHPDKDFFARITPSVCREDVRMWIKSCRVAYKRAFDKELQISYVAVHEYGPRTCRPHVHLAIMGIHYDTLAWLCKRWTYGFTKYEEVPRFERSSNDPWSGVAFYIGKYMSKGKFECQSVKDGSAQKPRVCQSIGLGTGDFESLKPYVCAFDLFGRYDLDSLCLESGRKLSKSEIDILCEEIPKRLTYRLNEKVILPLPRLIRNRIFYHFDKYEKPVKTAVWYLVTASLRSKYDSLREQEFREFLSANTQRTLAENCAAFEASKSAYAALEAASRETDLQTFYTKSLF